MAIELDIQMRKKVLYSLIAIAFILVIAGVAIAYTWNDTGHNAEEIGSSSGVSVQTRLCALEQAFFGLKDSSCT